MNIRILVNFNRKLRPNQKLCSTHPPLPFDPAVPSLLFLLAPLPKTASRSSSSALRSPKMEKPPLFMKTYLCVFLCFPIC